jgi:hypothetical protein
MFVRFLGIGPGHCPLLEQIGKKFGDTWNAFGRSDMTSGEGDSDAANKIDGEDDEDQDGSDGDNDDSDSDGDSDDNDGNSDNDNDDNNGDSDDDNDDNKLQVPLQDLELEYEDASV